MSGEIARFPVAKRGVRVVIRSAPEGFTVNVDPASLKPPPGLNLGPHRFLASARLVAGGIGILWRCRVVDTTISGGGAAA